MKALKENNKYKIKKYVESYKQVRFPVGSTNVAWTVPEGVTLLHIDCVASKGYYYDYGTYSSGNGRAGKGGRVECDLKVIPEQKLYFTVGEIPTDRRIAMYNASDIKINGTELTDRIIVAGGGGNGNSDKDEPNSPLCYPSSGGDGGGLVGRDGSTPSSFDLYGRGGTQTEGGTPKGEFGLGGIGNNAGGAGWYGGGGGSYLYHHSQTRNIDYFGGGGGGSSYTDPILCSNIIHTQGYNDTEGYIQLEYKIPSTQFDYSKHIITCKAFK